MPDFVGDRYYSKVARVIAVICALFVSFTYIAGQMKGVVVSLITPAPPQEIQDLVQDIRIPGQRKSHGMTEGGMKPAG